MKQTYGVPVKEIQRGIKSGVRKINVDTDCRMAITGAIRKVLTEDPSAFDSALERAADATRGLRADLEAPAAPEALMMERIRLFSAWLVDIGVVPREVQRAIARVEAAGGAAKISGAGSLCGPGAGSFLVYHPRAAVASQLLGKLEGIESMDLRLGAPGVRVDGES